MPDDDLIDEIIHIRKNYKIKIPDAFIAATALTNDLVLLTRNVEDFK
ncbi:MAG: PIN domain-containing protein, partial [Bacteroidetes bacterium]|nr:PIN domain-containing protein [Bacteroidota bacterium]